MKKILLQSLFYSFCCLGLAAQDTARLVLPLGGNSFVTAQAVGSLAEVTGKGWVNWQNTSDVFSTYLKLNKAGSLQVYALLNVPGGSSEIRCSLAGASHTVQLTGTGNREYLLGNWQISQPGYVKIDVQGLRKTGAVFANMLEWRIAGSAVDAQTAFVKNNDDNYFYWGRRGPSVHLSYDISEAGNNIEWFYTELTVPQGNDPVGSYFMADGFGEGYFGMQVNSSTERRILFSVWSPFKTDDPASIPADQKIRLLKKGAGVHTGEFGNEGSGGQSYLHYNWKAGSTYKFLLHALPADSGRTNYTAYFFAPELRKWLLVASFSRPHTQTYLKHLHSFLENFDPGTGHITRKAWYHNPWVKTSTGEWKPLRKAVFTGDATAKKAYRLDYDGGVEHNQFFLHNCGFFNSNTTLGSGFSITPESIAPVIDFASLE